MGLYNQTMVRNKMSRHSKKSSYEMWREIHGKALWQSMKLLELAVLRGTFHSG